MSLVKNRNKVEALATQHGGYIRMAEAIKSGVSRRSFYKLVDTAFLEQESRGLYRLTAHPMNPFPDLAAVSLRCPKAVIALVSALSFYDLTTHIPHSVQIFLPRGAKAPRIDWPQIECHYISDTIHSLGIVSHDLDGVRVPIYSIEKTVVDCFRFRNQVGFDIPVEALRSARSEGRINIASLGDISRACRIHTLMAPYIEAII
jgi:predicted transcriptional regulator of viral defense system